MVGTQGDPIKVVENLPGLARPSFGSGQLVVWGAAPTETRTYVDGVRDPGALPRQRPALDGQRRPRARRHPHAGRLRRRLRARHRRHGPRRDQGPARERRARLRRRRHARRVGHGRPRRSATACASASRGATDGSTACSRAVDAPDVDQFFAIPRYGDYQGKVQVALRKHESLDAVFLGSGDDLSEMIPDADPAHAAQPRPRARTTSASTCTTARLLDDGASVDVVPYVGHDASNLDASFGENPATLDESDLALGTARVAPIAVDAADLGAHPRLGRRRVERATSSARVRSSSRRARATSRSSVSRRAATRRPTRGPRASSTSRPYVVADLDLRAALTVSPGAARRRVPARDEPSDAARRADALDRLRAARRRARAAHLGAPARDPDGSRSLGAAGVYSQPPDPADLSAVFGNPKLGPETADHASLGQATRLTDSLSLETVGFYKWMANLAVRDPSPTPSSRRRSSRRASGARTACSSSSASSRGTASSAGSRTRSRAASGRTRRARAGASSTTTSRSRAHRRGEQGARRVDGRRALPLRDRACRARRSLGAFYDAKDDVYQPIFGAQNSIRLPDFWQLDLRVDRELPHRRRRAGCSSTSRGST